MTPDVKWATWSSGQKVAIITYPGHEIISIGRYGSDGSHFIANLVYMSENVQHYSGLAYLLGNIHAIQIFLLFSTYFCTHTWLK